MCRALIFDDSDTPQRKNYHFDRSDRLKSQKNQSRRQIFHKNRLQTVSKSLQPLYDRVFINFFKIL